MRHFSILLCVSALLLGGCATQYQTRGTETPVMAQVPLDAFEKESSQPHRLDAEARSIERFSRPEFTVGVIELTDDGEVNPAQHRQVMEEVKEQLKADQGALLIVFVHGWHHGCRTCDSHLACFRHALNKLSWYEQTPGGRGRNVVGVYLGWRGRAILGKSDFFSIWNRKRAAEHIGRTGGKEILMGLNDAWLEQKEKGKPVTMVTVGHSLGGALVFSAVKGKMSGDVDDIVHGPDHTLRIVRAKGERNVADKDEKAIRSRFGDLVVLVNPAIEASQYQPFNNDLPDNRFKELDPNKLVQKELPPDKNASYDNSQLPVLMTIASTADTAVGRWFPWARRLSALNVVKNAEIFTSRAESIGMGRYRPHFTHILRRNGDPVPDLDEEKREETKQCGCEIWGQSGYDVDESYLSLESLGLPNQGTRGEKDFQFDLVEERALGWDIHTPYLVISADKTIIGGHNDIFNPVFTGFLRKFLAGFEEKKPRESGAIY